MILPLKFEPEVGGSNPSTFLLRQNCVAQFGLERWLTDIQMEERKKILILAIIIVLIILVGSVFATYKIAYKRGANDQFQFLVNELVQSATNCRLVEIQLTDEKIQLVNLECYNQDK